MTWKCAFKKIYTIGLAHDVDSGCAPKNFNELWCLIDNIVAAIAAEPVELEQPQALATKKAKK